MVCTSIKIQSINPTTAAKVACTIVNNVGIPCTSMLLEF